MSFAFPIILIFLLEEYRTYAALQKTNELQLTLPPTNDPARPQLPAVPVPLPKHPQILHAS